MKDLSKSSYLTSISAMFTVLSVIVLYISSIVPAASMSMFFLAGLFICPLLYERKPLNAFLIYVCTCLISLLTIPSAVNFLPYVFLFGHYGLGKYFFEDRMKKFMGMLFKLIYFNLFMLIIYFVCFDTLFGSLLTTVPGVFKWLILEVCFFIYDFLYSMMIVFYGKHLRKILFSY